MSSKNNIVDYLSEDSPIAGQKFALISIIGPHMNQKCDVYGLKVKGVADSIEKAKAMSARLVKADPEFDIYTVEVGKFFPLDVEPSDIQDVEYQNQQLNLLIKSYLENRQHANDQYSERKNKMMQDAIREGKNQKEILDKKEHPVAVLQRISSFQDKIKKLQDELLTVQDDLKLTQDKYEAYSEEEKQSVQAEINKVLGTPHTQEEPETVSPVNVDELISQLQALDSDISELKNKLNATSEEHSPNMFNKLNSEMLELNSKKESLKEILTNKQLVNDYVNSSFETTSEYGNIENNVIKTL
jgi:hypothetical protein